MRTGGETLYRKVVKLALPMSLEGLLTASSDFADTLMVSSLGEASVSAVGLGTQLFFIQSMTCLLYTSTSHGSECTKEGFINYVWFELNRAWEEV